MLIYACDPGKDGALVLLDENRVRKIIPFNEDDYVSEMQNTHSGMCVLEQVHAFSGQGVTSTFNFGKNYGWIRGVLDGADVQIIDVSPQKWKGYFGLSKDKGQSITLCKKLYPEANLFRTPRCKKEHDGIAEAILIGRWYIENQSNKNNSR